MSMHHRWSSLAESRRVRRCRSRRLLLESLETRCLLAAGGQLSDLLYAGLADGAYSPTNAGLLMLVDTDSGSVAPWQATFSSPSSTLAAGEGFAGLAFSSSGRLYGATSGSSSSRLVEIDPVTGSPLGTPVTIRAGAQAVNIFDLAAGPGSAFQLYGIGAPAGAGTGQTQLYVIDPNTGQAAAVPNSPAWLTGLSRAEGLAWGPGGTLYVTGLDATDNSPKLYIGDPQNAQAPPIVHNLAERVVGLDVVAVTGPSGAAGVSLVGALKTGSNATTGAFMEIDPATGLFTRRVDQSAPTRGVAGDVAFHPDPRSLSLQIDHRQDFEQGNGGYWADNTGGTIPGMWHGSAGRRNDKLLNHTPIRNWYYGQFEMSTGGGNYLTNYDHQGVLNSSPIPVPECATSVLSFSYLLGTRESRNVDFVEVRVQYTDDVGRTQTDVVLSRAAGTLPQTGNRWLTATADLSPYGGRQVVVQFSFDTGDTPLVDPEGWYVDDVVVASVPKAVCGFKWLDEDRDEVWDEGEPGLNGWTIYADIDNNREFTAAQPEQAFYGAADADDFATGKQVRDAQEMAALSLSAAGTPVYAMPNPVAATGKVLAWGTAAGEAVWQVGQKLRIVFAEPVHTVSLQFARAGSDPVQAAVLQAFDENGNNLGERLQTLTGGDWQTLTFTDGEGEIAYVLASAHQGSVLMNGLQYWGTEAAMDGDPWVVTANDGRHDGAFAFDRLPPGTYEIREVLPEGWKQTSPGAPDFAWTVTVAPGQSVVGDWEQVESPNFGNFQPQISGYKWLDENRNGVWDETEGTGLNDWTIYLDLDQNGLLDGATEPFFETRWDGQHDGAFWFDGLAPGSYVVREEVPELWKQSYPGGGTQQHQVVVSGPGSVVGTWQDTESPNFGNYQQARLSGAKWDDRIRDGQWDTSAETGLPGWVIQAYRDANGDHVLDGAELAEGPAASQATNTVGQYELMLDPGDYVVVEIRQNGWIQSFPEVSAFDASVDLTAWPFGAYGHAVAAVAGQTYAGLDFGNYQAVDLRLTKTESADPVIAGSGPCNLTYVVTLTNLGPTDASGVEVSEDLTLPAGVTVCSITPSQGSFTPAQGPDGIWSVGELTANAQATLTVVLTVSPSVAADAAICDTATVTATNETRINPDDDTVTECTTVRREVDLRLTKSESVDPAIAGSGPCNLTYVVTVTNLGPSDASGVEVSEDLTLPAGVTVCSITPSQGSFAPPEGPDGIWSLGELPADAQATLTVVLTVGSSVAADDVICDTATVTATNEIRINPEDDAVTECTTVHREVDLRLTKTESVDPVIAGSGPGNLTYVVTVTNLGPSDASGVEIGEVLTLPAGVTVESITPPLDAAGTWLVGDLPAGDMATLTVVLTVSASAAAGTDVIGDTATVTHVNEILTDPGDDTITERTSVRREVDLRLTKSESADPVIAGSGPGNLTYVVTVTNLGPSDASGVEIGEVLTLPAGVTVESITPPLDSAGTWLVGDLPAEGSATLTVVLTVGASAAEGLDVIGDTATVTHVNEILIETGDDTITEQTSVRRETDLAMDKSDDGSDAVPGEDYTYALNVLNQGPSNSTGATVTDVLPAGWTFAASSNPTCAGDANDPQTVTCTIGSLAAGSTATFMITAAVPLDAATGTVTNWAEVEANETDPDSSNNQDSEETAVVRAESVIQFITPLSVFRPDLLLAADEPEFTDSQHGHVSGYLWYDANQNGAWEENEPPLSEWTVYADANGNDLLDEGEPSATTRDDGRYVLSNLPQGSHVIRQIVQPGWLQTSPVDPDERPVAVPGRATLRDVNFGVYRSWDVHGYKWSDLDQDGVWDADEPGMGGWPISLETDLEPDDFPVGTALNDVYAQLTLSAIGSDGNPSADPAVVSAEGLHPESGTADPDNRVFGHAASQVWSSDGRRLRIDFDQLQREVSIDVLAVGSGTSIGRLEVYDAAGNLLTSRTTVLLSPDGLTLQRITIPRSAGDIKYAVASAQQGSVQLDTLRSVGPPEASWATTAADGGYYFTGVLPGRYTIADAVPAAIQTYPASSAGHVIELASGQTIAGSSGTAETPNFGVFDYSPFVRPADNPPVNWLTYWSDSDVGWSQLQIVLESWQSFTVTNTTQDTLTVTEIRKLIAAPGDSFVSIYDDNRQPPVFPLQVQPGQSQRFWVFYTPNVPDWENGITGSHRFERDDRLEVVIEDHPNQTVFLVGESTYDSDITYDGVVDFEDARRLDDIFLDRDWPIVSGDRFWDPTSDINVRHTNGATAWPEIGLGDFGPINVEYGSRRAPFLDLDWNNSSGAKGADYVTTFIPQGVPVRIADPVDSRFANSEELSLEYLDVRITNVQDQGHEYLEADTRGTFIRAAYDPQTAVLRLSPIPDSPLPNLADYVNVLRTVTYGNTSADPTVTSRVIEVRAEGDDAFGQERDGNVARATVLFQVPQAASVPASSQSLADGEGGAVEMPVEATNADAVFSGGWHHQADPYDVNGEDGVTPRDALAIVNYLNAHPGQTSLPSRSAAAPPFYDVNADGACTPHDALLVVNFLERARLATAEGEADTLPAIGNLGVLTLDRPQATDLAKTPHNASPPHGSISSGKAPNLLAAPRRLVQDPAPATRGETQHDDSELGLAAVFPDLDAVLALVAQRQAGK